MSSEQNEANTNLAMKRMQEGLLELKQALADFDAELKLVIQTMKDHGIKPQPQNVLANQNWNK